MNEILVQAFEDELEKLAGLPKAVRKGGGGYVGQLMREKADWGKSVAKSKARGPSYIGRSLRIPPSKATQKRHSTSLRRRKNWGIGSRKELEEELRDKKYAGFGERSPTADKGFKDLPGAKPPRKSRLQKLKERLGF
jgi:hypothetical protein